MKNILAYCDGTKSLIEIAKTVIQTETDSILKLKNRIDNTKVSGNSDTEILVNLFEKYQESSLDSLKGMFSFVIYNIEKFRFLPKSFIYT